MTTRTQALLDALEQVDDSVRNVDERIDQAVAMLEQRNDEHALAMRDAQREYGKKVKDAGDSVAGGLIVGAVVLVGGAFYNTMLQLAIQRRRETTQYVQMFDSIVCLFERYETPLSYDFVLERSFAEGACLEDRQIILNGLIYAGIVEDNYVRDSDMLFLDPEGDTVSGVYELWIEQGLLMPPES